MLLVAFYKIYISFYRLIIALEVPAGTSSISTTCPVNTAGKLCQPDVYGQQEVTGQTVDAAIRDGGLTHRSCNTGVLVQKVEALEADCRHFSFHETVFRIYIQDGRIAVHAAAETVVYQFGKIITNGNISEKVFPVQTKIKRLRF